MAHIELEDYASELNLQTEQMSSELLIPETDPAHPPEAFRLSPEQVEQFHRDGFLAPLEACRPDQMQAWRPYLEKMLETPFVDEAADGRRHAWDAEKMGARKQHWGHNRHLDDRTLWEISTQPAIVGAMQSVLGRDLLLWRTNFFTKEPGAREIPWHQDRNYWPLEPEIIISAWLAIDRADKENACLQVIPGSHRKLIRHVKASEEMAFQEMADASGVDLTRKVDVPLEPGQFILFNERTLHHSEPNRSKRRRMGLAIRVIPPQVRILRFDSPSHQALLVSGEDPLGFNPIGKPPATHVA